jgi:hypothetical protein
MGEIAITFHLSEALVKEATELGLLSSERIEKLLRADIEAQLEAMANDPAIQSEMRAIADEFDVTEDDGLETL